VADAQLDGAGTDAAAVAAWEDPGIIGSTSFSAPCLQRAAGVRTDRDDALAAALTEDADQPFG